MEFIMFLADFIGEILSLCISKVVGKFKKKRK